MVLKWFKRIIKTRISTWEKDGFKNGNKTDEKLSV